MSTDFAAYYEDKENASRDVVINERYLLNEMLGQGSYGAVFRAHDLVDDRMVAVKTQPVIVDGGASNQMLEKEFKCYQLLAGGPGIPQVFWYGVYHHGKNSFNVMVMEQLGQSLQELMKKGANNGFRLHTVLLLADQMLETLQFLHDHHIAHRDIKPANFVLGLGDNSNQLFLIDLGLSVSTKFYSTKDKKYKHILNDRSNRLEILPRITGSMRYCSINAHYGQTLSRRDDVVSLAYMIYFLLNGSLPWMMERTDGVNFSKMVLEAKLLFRPQEIVSRPCLADFLQMAQNLTFEEVPDYDEWRSKFREEHESENLPRIFEWENEDCSRGESDSLVFSSSSFNQAVTC